MKWLFTVLYRLLTVWTGLLRGVEAKAYKPNALWFCMVMGLVSIAAGFLYRLEKKRSAAVTALAPVVIVFSLPRMDCRFARQLSTICWAR